MLMSLIAAGSVLMSFLFGAGITQVRNNDRRKAEQEAAEERAAKAANERKLVMHCREHMPGWYGYTKDNPKTRTCEATGCSAGACFLDADMSYLCFSHGHKLGVGSLERGLVPGDGHPEPGRKCVVHDADCPFPWEVAKTDAFTA